MQDAVLIAFSSDRDQWYPGSWFFRATSSPGFSHLTAFGFESTDEPQYRPNHESYNGKRADRQQVDTGEPHQTSTARIHPSQPFSGVLPRNTR